MTIILESLQSLVARLIDEKYEHRQKEFARAFPGVPPTAIEKNAEDSSAESNEQD